jgi:hemolysin activation/secretion protein
LAPGSVPDFNKVTKELVALNAWPDRQVVPTIRPGIEPHTVDVDLEVKDKAPLHGSLELNNRYSPDTSELRLNASVSYSNLWQKGHSFGLSTQVAPQRIEDALIVSAYYMVRFPQLTNFSLMLNGTLQDSNVSTLGGGAVAGSGNILGFRGIWNLPAKGIYFHSVSAGMDYKKFEENVNFGTQTIETPITYFPISVAYGGGFNRKKSFTDFNASVNFSLRQVGSDPEDFDDRRFKSDGGWIYLRTDASHTQDLPLGFQAFAKIQGQLSNYPLINSEQFAGGGTSTVRGYLESTSLGDNGWFTTVEFRTPSLVPVPDKSNESADSLNSEWRFHVFFDGGRLYLNDALPEQTDDFKLASFGVGTSMTLWDRVNGGVDLAWPLVNQGSTIAHDPFLSFRLQSEF